MKRYRLLLVDGLMQEDSNGKWVEWKDVEGLIIENRELTARNKRLIQITNQEGIKEDGI